MRRALPWLLPLLWAACSTQAPPPQTAQMPIALEAPAPVEQPAEAENLSADPSILEVQLRAAPHVHTVDGRLIEGYAYNGQTPGPTLRAKVGDTLRVHLQNDMAVATTIHWHGVDAPYDMDGVTWQKDPIAPGEAFTYEVPLTRAGTFWYHPHFDTERQVDLGLYGVVLVEDPAEPSVSTGDVERELVLVFDGWEEATDHAHPEDTAGHTHAYDLPTWTVNGVRRPTFTLPGGARVRARLVNSSNTGYLSLRWPDMRVIALDQGLLTAAQSPEALVLAPGDRAEVIFRVGAEGFPVVSDLYTLRGGPSALDPIDIFEIAVSDPAPAPDPIDWPWREATTAPLPTHADVVYVFSGSNHADQWLINGESFPDVTIEAFPQGSRPVVEIRNISPTEHPFHMHGNPFEVLSRNGLAVPFPMLEDTINVAIRETVRVRVHADNPGDWMTHCHIIGHAHRGMMTVFRVLDEEAP